MKEVKKVSISGIAFTFDADAYETMNDYIERLNRGYATNPDGKEIVADIEARIAELLLSDNEAEKVVSAQTVNYIIAQMGYPDDLSGSAPDSETERIPRRLYRNPDGAKIAGVCNGLGNFLEVDPAWIRLGIFLPLLLGIVSEMFFHHFGSPLFSLFGLVVLLYFLMWIAIPIARTPRQKLEMRGEKITSASIHRTFIRDAETISDSPRYKKSMSLMAELLYAFGRVVLFCIKAVALFVGFVFAVVAVCLIAVFISVLFNGVATLGDWNIYTDLTLVSPAWYVLLGLLCALLPFLTLAWLLISFVFGLKTNRWVGLAMFGLWVVLTSWFTVLTVRNIDTLRRNAQNTIVINTKDVGDIFDAIEDYQDRDRAHGKWIHRNGKRLRIDENGVWIRKRGKEIRIDHQGIHVIDNGEQVEPFTEIELAGVKIDVTDGRDSTDGTQTAEDMQPAEGTQTALPADAAPAPGVADPSSGNRTPAADETPAATSPAQTPAQ